MAYERLYFLPISRRGVYVLFAGIAGLSGRYHQEDGY